MNIRIVRLALLLALVIVLHGRQLLAQEVAIKDIVVTNSSTDLLLYLKVMDAFTPEMVKGVENGLPATFTFQVELTMVRSGWTDKEIFAGATDHTLTYDNLKKEYTVVFEEHRGRTLTTPELAVAQAAMAELDGFTLLSLANLEPDRQYVLKTRVILAKKTLPFYFHYLIPFGDFGDFDTDWHAIEFRY